MTEVQIILVDDEEEVRLSGKQTLELEGFDVIALGSAEEALDRLTPMWPGIVVSDVKMPRMNGIDLLRHIQDMDPDLPVVLVTGHGDVMMATQAIRDGAYDFIEKPAPPEYLISVVRRALEKRLLFLENRTLRGELSALTGLDGLIIGKSTVMESLRDTIANISEADVDVLLVGETGTGKELAARGLHDLSARKENRFVGLNCGAMPETIIESELFGHESGAFTGAAKMRIGKIEHAQNGTLFLDEIETMSTHLQVKLLRVLQERVIERLGGNDEIEVDIRVVAASKVDLKEACEKGEFREDLYYRLNVAKITLPPLRRRKEDITLLFQHFVATACSRYQRPIPSLEPAHAVKLMSHDWPGNVRELKNVAERFVLGISGDDFDLSAYSADTEGSEPLPEQMERFEKQAIETALQRHQGQINETAEALSIPRKKLYLKMRKFGLDKKDFQ
jgi:two-component system C4-dicarboxylate transport response regulator DctD